MNVKYLILQIIEDISIKIWGDMWGQGRANTPTKQMPTRGGAPANSVVF